MKSSQSNLANTYRFCHMDNGAQPSLQYNHIPGGEKSSLRLVWPAPSGTGFHDEAFSLQLAAIIAEVQAKEKKLIGQELHDNVNQILSMVKLFIEMLSLEDKANKEIQARTIYYLMEAINEIRKISGDLIAPKQEEKGLIDTLSAMIEDINFSTRIKIKLAYSGDINSLSEDKRVTIFRIVQEQLKNVIKYSRATHVLVALHLRNNEIILSIQDDGIGFDPKARSNGIGLVNITERTRSCKGTVQLQTAEGKGCSLNISIPAVFA